MLDRTSVILFLNKLKYYFEYIQDLIKRGDSRIGIRKLTLELTKIANLCARHPALTESGLIEVCNEYRAHDKNIISTIFCFIAWYKIFVPPTQVSFQLGYFDLVTIWKHWRVPFSSLKRPAKG